MRGEAADDVDGPARREGDDEPDRPRRIGVGGTRRAAPRKAGEGNAGGQHCAAR
jgi:hypothetical protein